MNISSISFNFFPKNIQNITYVNGFLVDCVAVYIFGVYLSWSLGY